MWQRQELAQVPRHLCLPLPAEGLGLGPLPTHVAVTEQDPLGLQRQVLLPDPLL